MKGKKCNAVELICIFFLSVWQAQPKADEIFPTKPHRQTYSK